MKTYYVVHFLKDVHSDFQEMKKRAKEFNGRYLSPLPSLNGFGKVPPGFLFTSAEDAKAFEATYDISSLD